MTGYLCSNLFSVKMFFSGVTASLPQCLKKPVPGRTKKAQNPTQIKQICLFKNGHT